MILLVNHYNTWITESKNVISYAYISTEFLTCMNVIRKNLWSAKLTEIISKLRSIQDSVRSWRYVSGLFDRGRSCNLTVEDFQVVLIACKLQIYKSSFSILMNILAEHHVACKYPYLLEHLVASLQGAGSLHLQCCIHLVIQTRLSDIPFKRNSLKSIKNPYKRIISWGNISNIPMVLYCLCLQAHSPLWAGNLPHPFVCCFW